ncbi:hypothetical protein Ciccas_009369, partial [Cichlidogyrus casuarinus]
LQKEDIGFVKILAAKNKTLNRAVFAIAPNLARHNQKKIIEEKAPDVPDTLNWGEEDIPDFVSAYNCRPPPIFIPIITAVEISVFIYYAVVLSQDNDPMNDVTALTGGVDRKGPLIYLPRKRYQAWRFLSYMLVHQGYYHIAFNCIVQLLLGILLEIIHKFWRVGIVYILGVIAGSLAQSVSDPFIALVGASGGVYALMGAHFASIMMNWGSMQKGWRDSPVNFLVSGVFQLLIMSLLVGGDFGMAVYTRYWLKKESQVGYVAHLGGFIAGILVGVPVLRNLEILKWEKVCFFICIILYIVFMIIGIVFNIYCLKTPGLCMSLVYED